jgi:hypothetical protein
LLTRRSVFAVRVTPIWSTDRFIVTATAFAPAADDFGRETDNRDSSGSVPGGWRANGLGMAPR